MAQVKSETVEYRDCCSVLCNVLNNFLTAQIAHNGMVIYAKQDIYIYKYICICFKYRLVYAFALVLVMY